MIARLADAPFSGLILSGETGTGKGLVARILHHLGPRAERPLVEVNCTALPHDSLEAELFGHEDEAFTGAKDARRGLLEQAGGGTLILDEIGEMGRDLQAKLLTALEDRRLRPAGAERSRPVDVQVLATTTRNLESLVRQGAFRSDLYHLLSVFELRLPPLRDRLEDLEELVPNMVEEFNATAGRRVRDIPASAYERMRAYSWPGNVRELRNVVERCVLLAGDERFAVRWLELPERPGVVEPRGPTVEGDRVSVPLDGSMALDEMDSYIIQTALRRNNYNVTATARALRTTRETLRYRIQKYHLEVHTRAG